METWKAFAVDDQYEISNMGNIRNARTKFVYNPPTNKHGVKRINLYINGKNTGFDVHRLVAQTFINNNDVEKKFVIHVNGNRIDNRAINLKWVTSAEQKKHARSMNAKPVAIASNESDWKTIPNYPMYEASKTGLIRSKHTGRTLKCVDRENGYSQVRLSLGSRQSFKTFGVHRLVALAWLPNPENKKTVNHKNRVKNDNCVDNLEWATSSEQVHHFQNTERLCPATIRQENTSNHENEIWKPIESMPGYEASCLGRIRNAESKHVLQIHTSGVYAQCKTKYGTKSIHRIIAETFLHGNCDAIVNHKDGNKLNNNVDNLEFITQSQNIHHAYSMNNNLSKRKVRVVRITGNEETMFESLTSAAKQCHLNLNSVTAASKYGIKYAGSFWKRV